MKSKFLPLPCESSILGIAQYQGRVVVAAEDGVYVLQDETWSKVSPRSDVSEFALDWNTGELISLSSKSAGEQ